MHMPKTFLSDKRFITCHSAGKEKKLLTLSREVDQVNRTTIVEPQETKRIIIRDFFALIEKVPNKDDQASIQTFLRYLQSLLRIKQVVPPVVEIMTVIKQNKPLLYHAARRITLPSSNLHMLFQLEMDIMLAHERLRQYDK